MKEEPLKSANTWRIFMSHLRVKVCRPMALMKVSIAVVYRPTLLQIQCTEAPATSRGTFRHRFSQNDADNSV